MIIGNNRTFDIDINNKKASFVLPSVLETSPGFPCVESILSQDWEHLEIVLVVDHEDDHAWNTPDGPATCVLCRGSFRSETIPAVLSRAAAHCSGDVIFMISDAVELFAGFTRSYMERLFRDEATALAYGNFIECRHGSEVVRQAGTDVFDYSENSQIGPVRGIKRASFDQVRGYDERLRYAFEYDLRLRLFDRFQGARIDKPLYRVLDRDHRFRPSKEWAHFSCYTRPDTMTLRSYVNYRPDEEKEFADACRASLKRQGSYLDNPVLPLTCAHVHTGVPSGVPSGVPRVSVVIPLWNRVEYIGRAIQSVLDGSWKEYEIIVVDNGSTDGSVEVVQEYALREPVTLYRIQENNVATALNTGIQASTGKYVSQLDSDDMYTSDALEVLVRHMESNPDSALGVSYYDRIGPDDEPIPDVGIVKHLEYDRNNLMRTDGIGAARIWHRCVLEDLGGFDEVNLGNYAEDYDMQLKLSEKYQVSRIPRVLYHYRMNHKKATEKIDYITRHQK